MNATVMTKVPGKWTVAVGIAKARLALRLIELPASQKFLLAITADFFVLTLGAVAAQFHCVGGIWQLELDYALMLLTPCFGVLGMLLSRSYKQITRYPSSSLPLQLGSAMLIAVVLLVASQLAIASPSSWWRISISFGFIGFALLLSTRVMITSLLRPARQLLSSRIVVIYGAGEAGAQLFAALKASGRFRVAAFVDDDKNKWGRNLAGLRIYSAADLPKLRANRVFDSILLAIPSATRSRRREVLLTLEPLAAHVFEMPSVDELVDSGKRIDDLREVQVEDLLGRDSVDPIEGLMRSDIAGRVVLVTGAGGSIGSELCRQALQWGAAKLILLDVSEVAIYRIDQELRPSAERHDCELVPVMGTVLDRMFLARLLSRHAVDTVYHSAAYKHVPLVEHNIVSAVTNNVLGTWRTVHAAQSSGVSNFVLISTDKAVRPTSVMGASKRVCEQILQGFASRSTMRMSMVRFGNVLDSSGSVVPLFRAQIAAGGPVTVTHRDITRYFMTIREAAQLVIQAGAMGGKGAVFVLDMGMPVRIWEMAVRMIHLAGLRVRDDNYPDGDISVRITGLRPGEKLYEELLLANNPEPTQHPRIFLANEEHDSWSRIESVVAAIQFAAENDASDATVLAQLSRLVQGFSRPESEHPVPPSAVRHDAGNSEFGYEPQTACDFQPGTAAICSF